MIVAQGESLVRFYRTAKSIPYVFSPCAFSSVTWKHRGDIGQIVESLTKRKIRSKDLCHLDPDLRRESVKRRANWRPAFGQMGSEQSHLRDNGVTTGDLFLFFGLFRQARRTAAGWQFASGTLRLHVVYGWLEIGEIVAISDRQAVLDDYPWLRDHPHANDLARWKGENVVYLPTEHSSIGATNSRPLPGSGLLKYHQQQILTAKSERHTNGRVSYWDIKPWAGDLGNERLSRFCNEKNLLNKSLLKTAGRWQEMVIDTQFYPKAKTWASRLLANSR